MNLNANEVLLLTGFVVVLPAVVFFAMGKAKLRLRIGFTLFVLILGSIAAPNFMRPRMTVSTNACVNNLRNIEEAKLRWAEANHKGPTEVPTMSDLFSLTNAEGNLKYAPSCPDGGTYSIGAVNEEAKCSIGPPQHTLHPSSVII